MFVSAISHKPKHLSFFVGLLLCILLAGCGSNTSSPSAQETTVSGQISLPADSDFIAATLATTSVDIWVEQLPSISAKADSTGHFSLKVPSTITSLNLVAMAEAPNASQHYLQRTNKIFLNQGENQITAPITLEKGVNRLFFTLKDRKNNPIRYAPLNILGKSYQTDYYGRVAAPALPASMAKADLELAPVGFVPISASIPVFTEDLGPSIELALATSIDGRATPLLYFNAVETDIPVNTELRISMEILDPSLVLSSNQSPVITCSEGTLTPLANPMEFLWKAPAVPGLATITAQIQATTLSCTTSLGFVVGNSRHVNTKVTGFSPGTAAAGQTVTIKGYGFGERDLTCKIEFGGAFGDIISWSDTEIKVTVPRDAETAPIRLTKGDQTVICNTFTVIDYQASIYPTYGPPGAIIKVTGYGFGDSKGSNDLNLDDVPIQNIIKWTNTEIEFIVENLAMSGAIELIIRNRARYVDDFTVSRLLRVTPTRVTHYVANQLPHHRELTTVIISGEGFGDEQDTETSTGAVYFFSYDDQGAPIYVEGEAIDWDDYQIEVEVPLEARTGDIRLSIHDAPIYGPDITIVPPSHYFTESQWSGQMLDSAPIISQVAMQSNGNIILADNSNYLLWVYDNDYYLMNTISLSDANTARLPYGIAADANDNLYVSDMANGCIVKTTPEGAIAAVSTHPFGTPLGLCIDSQNRLYVADGTKNQVVVLDNSLNLLTTFGAKGSANGLFSLPRDLCLSHDETKLYVADSNNHRIQTLTIGGTAQSPTLAFANWLGHDETTFDWHTSGFSTGGTATDKFNSPSGVACDAQHLYVADGGNGCIKQVNLSNLNIFTIGEKGSGSGQFFGPSDVLISGSELYIADSDNGRVQVIATAGQFLDIIKPDTDELNIAFVDVALNDKQRMIYALDSGDCTVSMFDYFGEFEQKFGSKGSGKGQLLNPSGIALDPSGNVYVVDTGNARVVKFDQNGDSTSFGEYGTGVGQFRSPQKIAIGEQRRLYISDFDNHRVLIFNSDFSYHGALGEGVLNEPMGIAIASDGSIYVADSGNHRVCKFDKNRQLLGWLGSSDGYNGGWHTDNLGNAMAGSAPGVFDAPAGLAIDFEDCLYVVDYKNYNVQKFGPNHQNIRGDYISMLNYTFPDMVLGLDVDEAGCLFTVNNDNHVKLLVPLPISD